MRVIGFAAAAVAVAVLSGCSGQQPLVESPSTVPTAEPTVVETAAPVAETFTQPEVCASILPSERLLDFESRGYVLLGGPDGRYGDEYLLDPSPEQEAGGVTCIWGATDTEISSVTISVAPLSPSSRATAVASLTDQGLNEDVDDTSTVYWQIGDTALQPAIVNVLTADSWISVIQTIGGTTAYGEAETLAREVRAQVYTAD